jgi:hypothetical protein
MQYSLLSSLDFAGDNNQGGAKPTPVSARCTWTIVWRFTRL